MFCLDTYDADVIFNKETTGIHSIYLLYFLYSHLHMYINEEGDHTEAPCSMNKLSEVYNVK